MSRKELSYEQQLETMNEEGLRQECLRLKRELDRRIRGILSEPVKPVQQLTNPRFSNDLSLKRRI